MFIFFKNKKYISDTIILSLLRLFFLFSYCLYLINNNILFNQIIFEYIYSIFLIINL